MRGTLLTGAFCIAVALAGLAVLLAGCVATRVECPLGTYATRVNTDTETEGDTGAAVSVPTASGNVAGRWKTAGSVDWTCKRICPRGTLLRAREDRGVRSVECVSAPRSPADGGAR